MWVSYGEQYFPIHQMKPSQEDWQKLVFKRKNCSVIEKLSSLIILLDLGQVVKGDLIMVTPQRLTRAGFQKNASGKETSEAFSALKVAPVEYHNIPKVMKDIKLTSRRLTLPW